jgi:hypothetical protein
LDIFDASTSFGFAYGRSSEWSKATSSFASQLKELNDYNENNFEWQRVGEFIKPKTIKVVKLVKSLMTKSLIFSRVKREYYDAPFKRTISLNTFNNAYLPSNIQDTFERLRNLEMALKNSEAALYQKINQTKIELNASQNNQSNILQSQTDILKSQTNILQNDLKELKGKIKGYKSPILTNFEFENFNIFNLYRFR